MWGFWKSCHTKGWSPQLSMKAAYNAEAEWDTSKIKTFKTIWITTKAHASTNAPASFLQVWSQFKQVLPLQCKRNSCSWQVKVKTKYNLVINASRWKSTTTRARLERRLCQFYDPVHRADETPDCKRKQIITDIIRLSAGNDTMHSILCKAK